MRDPARIDRILGKLAAYWHVAPDLRLGQIIDHARRVAPDTAAGRLVAIEDSDIEAGLDVLVAAHVPAPPARCAPLPADLERLRLLKASWGYINDDFIRNAISHRCDDGMISPTDFVDETIHPSDRVCRRCAAVLSYADKRLLEGW